MVEKKAYKIYYRVMLSRYRAYTTCPACDGTRLRPEALNVRVGGRRLPDVVRMTVTRRGAFILGWSSRRTKRMWPAASWRN